MRWQDNEKKNFVWRKARSFFFNIIYIQWNVLREYYIITELINTFIGWSINPDGNI